MPGCRGRAALWLVLASAALASEVTPEESLRVVLADPEYVDVSGFAGVSVDLRYATADNFVHANVYGPFDRPFLRKPAAEKLERAAAGLREARPGWKIRIWDATRPRSGQRGFWSRVVETPLQPYVADPAQGSVHNFGFALDVTLLDEAGTEVDMGTGFDAFSPLAEPRREGELAQCGKLTRTQVENRRVPTRAIVEG